MTLEIRAISTTVSCSVSGGEGHLSAEVDGRTWGYNGGRSTYYKGDSCFVIVYKSDNLATLTGRASGDNTFKAGATNAGYNLKRESISFPTPISSCSKPIWKDVELLHEKFSTSPKAGGPEYMLNTTVVRLTTWTASLKLESSPPYGSIFIEYEPSCCMWVFEDLKRNNSLVNTEVHGAIFGVAIAQDIDFKPF